MVRERKLAGPGEIHGSVLAQVDGRPLAGALVKVRGAATGRRTREDGTGSAAATASVGGEAAGDSG